MRKLEETLKSFKYAKVHLILTFATVFTLATGLLSVPAGAGTTSISPSWVASVASAASSAGGHQDAPASNVSQSGGITTTAAVPDGNGPGATSSSSVRVTTHGDSTQGVSLSSTGSAAGTLAFSLPFASTDSTARTIGGVTTYVNTAQDFGTTVEPLANGSIQSSVVLAGSQAPTSYSFTFTTPGISLVMQGNGSVAIDSAGKQVGSVAAPWATDATGQPVSTSYSVNGNVLTQNIVTTSATAYPVTADPMVTFGWYVYLYLSHADLSNFVSLTGGISVGVASWWLGKYACPLLAVAGPWAIAAYELALVVSLATYGYYMTTAYMRGGGIVWEFIYGVPLPVGYIYVGS